MMNRLLFAMALTGFAGIVHAGSIGNEVAEQTGPDTYVITFDAPKTAFLVEHIVP